MSSSVENTIASTTSDAELQVFSLDPQKQRFIQLYMTGAHSNAQIAQLLQLHPNTIGKWLKREDVKNAIAEAQGAIHEQVSSQIKNLTLKATMRLHDLVESPIDAVALQAVKDILDRGGHKPKNEIKVDKTITTVEQKMKELIDSTITFEGEFEEVESE